MNPKKLPIGYWISQADKALTNGIDSIHEAAGITRTGWQLLNSIKENGSTQKTALLTLLTPLTDKEDLDVTIEIFRKAQLIEEKQGILFLTAKGQALHEESREKQKTFRQKTMQGINEQEYQTTVLTLQRMVENIQNDQGISL